jgi:hypothetical protein
MVNSPEGASGTKDRGICLMNQDLPNDPEPLSVDDVWVIEAGADGTSLHIIVENDVDLPELFRKGYHTNKLCSKILAHPEAHLCF